jgi:hypothetical protein
MEPHGISQYLMGSYGTSWNLTEPHEIPWKVLESHGRLWNITWLGSTGIFEIS